MKTEKPLVSRLSSLLDVERDPAAVLDVIERLAKRRRRNVAEAERCDSDQAVEPPLLELGERLHARLAELPHVVLVVDARPVAIGRHLRFFEDVEPDDPGHAVAGELLADHSVPCAELENAQLRKGGRRRLHRIAQDVHDLLRRLALQPVVEELLIEARALVDRTVVVEPDGGFPAVVLDQGEMRLVLVELVRIECRKANAVSGVMIGIELGHEMNANTATN